MSKGRKAGKAIGWIAGIALVVGLALVIGFNWNGIKAMFSGATLYTQTDIENAYNDGYNEGLANEENYQQQIAAFKKLIEVNTKTINGLNEQIVNLTGELDIAKGTIEQNAQIVVDLNTQIETLRESIASYDTRIEALNAQIETLTAEKAQLEKDAEDNAAQIKSLQTAITNLTIERDTLKDTVNQHVATINTLTLTIEALNGQISDKDAAISTLNTQIEALQSSIREYEQDVERYKQTIEELKKLNTCVVTFIVDGVLITTQQVAKTESPTSFDDPVSDAYVFHGWLLNGVVVDPFTYSVTEDVNFVADISKFYTVTFEVEGLEPITQKVLGGTAAENVSIENTEEYVFNGWLLNGMPVQVATHIITSDIKFTADLTYYRTVTFKHGETVLSTSKVLEGQKITNIPEVEYNSDLQRFVGWSWNETLIDLSMFIVEQDITIVANFEAREIAMKIFAEANELGIKEYYLYDYEDLNMLAEVVNAGNALIGYTMYLANDIDLQGKVFNVIGDTSATNVRLYFSGSIDGQNHAIYNLTSNTYGLIGNLRAQGNTFVKNLHLKNVNIDSNKSVGGLISNADSYEYGVNYMTIENCSISGRIKTKGNYNGAAGLISNLIYRENCTILKCWNDAEIIADYAAAGLIHSFSVSSIKANCTILEDCYNSGTVQTLTGLGYSASYVAAGLIGMLRDDSKKYTLSVNNCYSSGNITGKTFVGGLIGEVYAGNVAINNCFVTGTLEAEKNTDISMTKIGGLIAQKNVNTGRFTISNCYIYVTSSTYLDAIVGMVKKAVSGGSGSDTAKTTFGTCVNTYYGEGLDTLITSAQQNVEVNSDTFKDIDAEVYATWDFDNVWKIEPGKLPTLREVA